MQLKPMDAPPLARPPLDDNFAKPAGNNPAPRIAPTGPMVFTPPQLNLPAVPPEGMSLPAELPSTLGGLLPKQAGTVPTPTQGSAAFQGSWSGTYQGADEGTFTIKINALGVINGSGVSDKFGVRFPLFGTVRGDGDLNVVRPAVGLSAFGVQFAGEVAPATGKGSWSSGPPLNAGGTWQMRRN